jgi:hypothetical protein
LSHASNAVGRDVHQAVSRWLLTAGVPVRARVSPCGICGRNSGTMTVIIELIVERNRIKQKNYDYKGGIFRTIDALWTSFVWNCRSLYRHVIVNKTSADGEPHSFIRTLDIIQRLPFHVKLFTSLWYNNDWNYLGRRKMNFCLKFAKVHSLIPTCSLFSLGREWCWRSHYIAKLGRKCSL